MCPQGLSSEIRPTNTTSRVFCVSQLTQKRFSELVVSDSRRENYTGGVPRFIHGRRKQKVEAGETLGTFAKQQCQRGNITFDLSPLLLVLLILNRD